MVKMIVMRVTDLSHNHLGEIGQHDFPRLTKLLWLNLTDNGIKEFSGKFFARNQLLGE